MEFRNLTVGEIECRVQSIRRDGKGLTLLLYKNARCDMNILDEAVGAANWQREHYECKGNLFCRVGINVNTLPDDNNPVWVWKADCGTESNTEAQKGEASDSFKRACVNWGIGRELYTAPNIWIPSTKCEIKDTGRKDKNGNPIFVCYDHFLVEAIRIENKTITGLAIINDSLNVAKETDKRVFVWKKD